MKQQLFILTDICLVQAQNACGPAPFDEHKKTIVSEYENSFTVKPIGNQNV